MFTACELKCLQKLAQDCKNNGLSRAEAELALRNDIGKFSTPFRIQQALSHTFNDAPPRG